MIQRKQMLFVSMVAAVLVAGCSKSKELPPPSPQNAVELRIEGMEIHGPAEIPPGWTRFSLNNASGMTHFTLIWKMPEGKGIKDHQAELAPVFQEGMNLLNSGDRDAAMAAFGKIPEWYGGMVPWGGPGFVGAGRTTAATVHLAPGTYLVECYVKTNGIFHSYTDNPAVYAMVYEFTVPDGPDNTEAPAADFHITLSNESGIEVDGTPRRGHQTVAVHFKNQKLHENFARNDVHLVKLGEETDLEQLEQWMNWMLPGGLETPAPAQFLGGLNEMPEGNTAYFEVDLEAGDYAWVSEVAGARSKGMLQTFRVD